MSDVVMPRLSDSMEEGTILAWNVAVGDAVEVGQEIAEIETDKANMGYESDVAGTVVEIVVAEGESAPVGAVIARVGEPDGQGPSAPTPTPPVEEAVETGGSERVKASPLARRLASERGLDLGSIEGSGPGGRIVKADVEGAATAPPPATAPHPSQPAVPAPAALETAKGEVRVQELSKGQQVIARRMAESKATAPHFYLTTEVEMTKAVEARKGFKAAAKEGDVVPSFNDMVVKACAIALREFPKANGAYKDGRFELYSRVNVGVAVAAEESLVVPTVFDADRKGLREIARDARALATKVRDGSITPPELSGGTFTVSNLGMYGITEFAAVINLPQAGILAVGSIREAPVVRDGEIAPGQLMKATLSCDHRILYGAEGAEFLARVRALLEEPVSLAL
jgi:pyruvate dehydrogenase E2 component (dihydrolipoamide acetyltransferase)